MESLVRMSYDLMNHENMTDSRYPDERYPAKKDGHSHFAFSFPETFSLGSREKGSPHMQTLLYRLHQEGPADTADIDSRHEHWQE